MKIKLLIIIGAVLLILLLLNPSINNLKENISKHISYPTEVINKKTKVYRTKNFLLFSFYTIETKAYCIEIDREKYKYSHKKFHNITSVFGIFGNTYTLSSTTIDID